MRYAMIMAGGVGKRLWPMSRRRRPKQLLPLIDGRSLLQLTAGRLEGLVPQGRRLLCTSEAHRSTIRETLPEFTDDQILGEPVGRDTLNAAGFTAAVLHDQDPDAIFAVLTADHIIEPLDEFKRKVQLGFDLVEDDPTRLVTFSIMPTSPATGYGYVERGDPIAGFQGGYVATQFIEKPDAAAARAYVEAGRFGWNSGMFVFSARSLLQAIEWYKPRARAGLAEIAAAWGTDRRLEVLARVYPTLPQISIDYAVMEPASRDDRVPVCTVAMGVWWTDVGSWPAYGETLPADKSGCRTSGRSLHLDSRNVLVVSDDPDHTIATVGCEDLIVVHTNDVTMICPASKAEQVKDLANHAGDLG